jgi:hypothetical protein
VPLDTPTQVAGVDPAAGREPTLDVLEALARGEIDVAEAERRLAAVPAAGVDHAHEADDAHRTEDQGHG